MGPAAVRVAGLLDRLRSLGIEAHDLGDIDVPLRERLSEKDHKEKFLSVIASISSKLCDIVEGSVEKGKLPLTIGGDHSLTVGSFSGVSRYFHKKKKKLGLLWFDAHADINTPETSPSGNIHGMPVAIIAGEGHPVLTKIGFPGRKLNPEHTALIGIRAVDETEKKLCRDIGMRVYTLRDIDERGWAVIMREIVEELVDQVDGVHVSFDLDGVDPDYAPGVSTPVMGGLSLREAHLALEMIADTGKLVSMDFMELNPSRDRENQSAHLMVELICSLLGKTII